MRVDVYRYYLIKDTLYCEVTRIYDLWYFKIYQSFEVPNSIGYDVEVLHPDDLSKYIGYATPWMAMHVGMMNLIEWNNKEEI